MHNNKETSAYYKNEINNFLKNNLKLELHEDKAQIIPLHQGVQFLGLRNFYYFKLLRKGNIRKMILKIIEYNNSNINNDMIIESFQGWQAYAKWSNTYKLRKNLVFELNKILISKRIPKEN